MQKLSRAELKMWMLVDGVIGDPHGFGKRQDPFSAVAAVMAGTATTAVTIAAVGEVGLAMGVVGAVTGSKDLMKVGGVLGLASGIGSIANSAFGAASSASEGIASSAVDSVGSDWASGAADAMNPGLAASSATAGLEDLTMPLDDANIGKVDANGYTSTIGDSPEQIAADKIDNPYLNSTSSQPGAADTAQTTASTNATQSGTQPFSDARFASQNAIDPSYTTSNATDPLTGGSYFDRLKGYLKTDKGMNSAMQLGAGALSGIGKAYNDNRTYQLNKDIVDLKKQQQDRGNQQVRVAGIINQARA